MIGGARCRAAALQRILAAPGVSFVNLQVGARAGEIGLADLSPHLMDFAETAALIAALDLVVTVDTSVAHVAGALGKPAWVMLPYAPDWRWLLGRDDSPWYTRCACSASRAPGDWEHGHRGGRAELARLRLNATTHAPTTHREERMFETTIAGSLPKPAWLAEPNMLWAPWKLSGDELALAKRDATLLAIKQQEDAGIDIVTDGEQSRQHFVHGFLENVEGIDFGRRVEMGIRDNRYKAMVPTVTGPLRLRGRVHATEARVARAHTARKLKFTLPGPMTIVDTIADTHYGDRVALAMAFAALLNEEARGLQADGVDVIQFDEPAFNVYMDAVGRMGRRGAGARGRRTDAAPPRCISATATASRRTSTGRARSAPSGASTRRRFPVLAKSRIDQVSLECRNAHVPMRADAAAGRQGRAGRRHRRGDRPRGDARGSRRHDRGGAGVRAARSGCSPAPTAAWRRCGATWRRRSWRRSARVRRWRAGGWARSIHRASGEANP